MGELVFLREEFANKFCNIKWSALKAHIQVTLYRLGRLYEVICTYASTYMHVITIMEKYRP